MAMMKQCTGSGLVTSGNAKYCGFEVVVTTATGVINIRKDTVSGTIIATIAVGTTAAQSRNLASPIAVGGAIFVEYNGGATGTVNVLFE